jgi:aspartate aminotransferase
LASEAALSAPESYLEGVINEYTARRNTLINQLEQIPYVEVSKPMGAFYCIVKLPVKDAEDFSRFLLTDFNLNNQTVMLAPAKGFYSSPNVGLNEVRIAFILDQKKLILAATILEKALEAYKKFVN